MFDLSPLPARRSLAATLSLCAVMAFAGCASSSFIPPPIVPPPIAPPPPSPPNPDAYPGLSFSAVSQAGSTTILGASLALYAAGATGNGSAAISLLSSPVVPDAAGLMIVPAGYSCPAASSLLYLVSRGGSVGSAAENPNISLMAALGPCNTLAAGTTIVINEVTTVASMFALAPFYAPDAGVGASATNLLGLTNAFQTVSTLADPATGLSPGPLLPANAVSPALRIHSLANILHSCIVSTKTCSALYAATTVGTSTPANTLDALFNLARNPAANVPTLYAQSQVSPTFNPGLTTTPADWTIFLTLSGGGLNPPPGQPLNSTPSGIALDSTGEVWVSNYFGTASKFSTTGAPVFQQGITGFGLNHSYGLAIDANDNAWIPNEDPYQDLLTNGSVSVLTPAGTSAAGPNGFIAGGLYYPISVAIDPDQTVWVVNYGNSHVTLLNPSGRPLSGLTGYTLSLPDFPVTVAIDANHFGWIGYQDGTNVTKVSRDGKSLTNYSCCSAPSGLALDQGNNVWVANFAGASVSLISNTGVVVSNAGYTGAGSLNHPQGIAIDGSGDVWVANFRAPYLTHLSGIASARPGTSLSPSTGLGADAKLLDAYALAIDASGNIWVSNAGSQTITKFIGLAAPVKTPLSGLPQQP